MVQCDMSWDPMFGEYMGEEQLSYLWGIYCVVGGYEYHLLCQSVNDY